MIVCVQPTARWTKADCGKRQNAYVVRGMCHYNKDNLTAARESFVSCRNESRRDNDNQNVRTCSQWITFIDRERDRLAKLASAQ